MKFYFEHKDAEICYTKSYFINLMKDNGISEIEVYTAMPTKEPGIFWCDSYGFLGEKGEGYCGKSCRSYEPRNGKSGRCRSHSTNIYEKGEKVILKIN